jgi:hypothetical protein
MVSRLSRDKGRRLSFLNLLRLVANNLISLPEFLEPGSQNAMLAGEILARY